MGFPFVQPGKQGKSSLFLKEVVVRAISADSAAGVRGLRADSPPPVVHSPTPIYVPVFLFLVVSRLFCPCSYSV